jgi:GT2 family glycosyltransferase
MGYMTDIMTTSIMMVTYNRLELTQRMLDSFFKNTTGPHRLIIVDNGSTDGTKEWLEKLAENEIPLHLHFNSKNEGIAVGRNQGLLLANKFGPDDEYLVTMDNDIEVTSGWLSECTDIIKDNHKMAIGINFEGTSYPLVTRKGKTFQLKPIGNLGTACSAFHRDLHKQIGFFTTEYGLYGEEDADFYFRARIAGWEMGYLKNNGVHFGEGSLDVGEYREFKTESHKNNLAKFQKNCYAYMGRTKPNFIEYSDSSI